MIFFAELGDKTQFLMIAMASKYRIRTILIGVGAAICALNALAIVAGTLLGGFLPVIVINIVAGLAFLCFAYMALGDGSEEENTVGEGGSVFTVFGTFFLAELGDKTQLTALTLAADAGIGGFSPERALSVFAGASFALMAADVLGLIIGYFLGKSLPAAVFSRISFGIFSVFGALKLLEGFEGIFGDGNGVSLAALGAVSLVSVIFAALVTKRIFGLRGTKHKKDDKYGNEKNEPAEYQSV